MKLFESNNCKIFILFFLFIPNKLSNLSQLRIHVLQRYKTNFLIHFIDLYLFNIEFRSGGFVNPIPDITK